MGGNGSAIPDAAEEIHIQGRDNMEIRNDLSSRVVLQGAMGSAGMNEPQQATTVHAARPAQGISSEQRSMVNAMTLMQTASGIVQEALNVSSKLRMLAMSSMITGQTDQNEISETIAGIRSSLQQYGQPINAPAVQQSGERVSYGMPDIGNELNTLGSLAKKSQVTEGELKPVISSLEEKRTAANSSVEQLGKRMGAVNFSNEKSPAPATDVAALIVGNHAQALNAQGNVRNDAVLSLTR